MASVDMSPVLRTVDAVTVPVPDLDQGLAFYRDGLGHDVIWRNDEIGQAGLRLPDGETEIVLSQHLPYAPNWLVTSVSDAVADVIAAGGVVVVESHAIAVGRLAVVANPFGNSLVLLDLSTGRYAVDDTGRVAGVEAMRQPVADGGPLTGDRR
jgi:catechol 2,3-dioxygenase-like lactoylglutathione lyase family enzyme